MASRTVLVSLALLVVAALAEGCATQECDFHSQCGPQFYCSVGRCRQDCRMDFDCAGGLLCSEIGQCVAAGSTDAGPPRDGGRDAALPFDAGPPPDAEPGSDAGTPRDDAGSPDDAGTPGDGGTDAGPPRDAGSDAGPPPGRYLDRCTLDVDCTSGMCQDDRSGTRFCTRTCGGHSECATEHVCASGRCVPNDVGESCAVGADCALNICATNTVTGQAECTRTCANASDCPSGHACVDGGGTFVCIDIEQACGNCITGLCLASGLGCTATCRNAADCPRTYPSIPYECAGGHCIPSTAIAGPDPMGAACREVGGDLLCRSGLCIDDDLGMSVCSQVCSERGTCGAGFSCVPADDGAGGVLLLCQRTTEARDLASPCTSNPQCASGICHATLGFCTRLCTSDLLCPTGLTCRPEPGAVVSTCQP